MVCPPEQDPARRCRRSSQPFPPGSDNGPD